MITFDSEVSMYQVFQPKNSFCAKFGYKNWDSWEINEAKGLFGIPDQIVLFWKKDNRNRTIYRTIACEIKRYDWKRALSQAYRYKSFAHYSIVVLENAYVHRAKKAIEEFKSANIGLASLSFDGNITWCYKPRYQKPYSLHMEKLLIKKYYNTIE